MESDLSDEENEIPTEDNNNIDMHSKFLEDLRRLNCSENGDEEAAQQRIIEDSKLACYKVLRDDDNVSCVNRGLVEGSNFEECSASDEENLITH